MTCLAPVSQWQDLNQVLHQWHSDALRFLHDKAPKILIIVILAAVLLELLRMITRRLRRLAKKEGPAASRARAQQLATLSGVIYGAGLFVILGIALMQILKELGVEYGPLLASAGIAGLAIGFGAQTLVKDVINGFFILVEDHYDVGDTIKAAGVQGIVEDMSLRRTVLRDADGSLHVVPNSEIKIVSNLTRDWTQVSLHISVAYTESSDRVISILKEVASEFYSDPQFQDDLVSVPEVPGIERVTGTEVDYLVLVKTRPGKQYSITRELRRRIKECFEKNNIQPAGPARMYVMSVSGLPGQPAQ